MTSSRLPADQPSPSLPEAEAVDAAAGFTVLNTYHVCPEDPSGTWVAYTRLLETPTDGDARVPAEVWVQRRATGERHLLRQGLRCRAHEGANLLWVGEGLLAAVDDGSTVILDAATGRVVASHDWQVVDWSAVTGRQIGVTADGSEVRTHHPASGTTTLFRREDLARFAARMNGSATPADWRLSDTRWAPDGRLFSFHLMTNGWETANRHLLTAAADGSDARLFGLKPMHDGWYDAGTIFGHADQVADGLANDRSLRCWDRDGRVVIARLAPAGCHVSIDSRCQLVASETWYGSSPVQLRLYRTADPERSALLMSNPSRRMIWGLRAHVNPAFSQDGRRLYYNHAVSDQRSEVRVLDLAGALAGSCDGDHPLQRR